MFYRDFAFRVGARCVVLGSPFRDDIDDYAAQYAVLDVSSNDPGAIIARASAVEVPVTAGELDATRRKLRLEHGRIPGCDA